LCETACPENAITRQARFVFDTDERMRTRVLNEEPPFHCVRCGKPFATCSVMERMREQLENHPMFQQPGALQRIQMCADCRVKDMFVAEGGLDQG
jgi:ferredoxin